MQWQKEIGRKKNNGSQNATQKDNDWETGTSTKTDGDLEWHRKVRERPFNLKRGLGGWGGVMFFF